MRSWYVLGFTQAHGRHFTHPDTPYFVEFPGVAIQVGDQPIVEFAEIKTSAGSLKLLRPTECVMGRLAAFFHWNDFQGLEQAVQVAIAHPVDIEAIRKWSKREGKMDAFQRFLAAMKAAVPPV